MGIAACDLSQHVIRPTLLYLGCHCAVAEALLLGTAASQSALGSALDDRRGQGLYRIPEQRHLQLWDRYLARDPELASRVRGLASQHAFLADPELELCVNLRYACAMAWVALRQALAGRDLQGDLDSLALLWRQVFAPQGRLRRFYQQAAQLQPRRPHVA